MDHSEEEDDNQSIMSDIKEEPEDETDEDFDQEQEQDDDHSEDYSPSNKNTRKRKAPAPKNKKKGKSPSANSNKRKRQNENKSSKKVDEEEEEEPFDISDLGDYFLCTKCNSVSFSQIDHLITHFKKCTTPKPKVKGILGNSNKINIETKNMSSQTIPDVTTIGIQTKPETKTIYTQIRTKLTIEPKAQSSSSSSQLNEDYSSNFDDDGPIHSPMNQPENEPTQHNISTTTHNNDEGTREVILNVKFKDPFQERDIRGGPFQCPVCQKEFKNQRAVNMHSGAHREERQYMKCPIRGCEFRDKDPQIVAAHVREEHPIGCMGQVSKRTNQNVVQTFNRSPRKR